jgi:phosphatidylglycerol---prolipoprotein diacylglyceryl transferase
MAKAPASGAAARSGRWHDRFNWGGEMPGIHFVFDCLASLAAFLTTLAVYHWRLADAATRITTAGTGYPLALVGGAVAGAYITGTLNLWLSGVPQIGRSIIGAMAGAILAIEIYKRVAGIAGSTGLIFVPAFAVSVMIGRIGCFMAGLDDQTHGIITTVPWAVDFGDGLPRHPVQLYESAAMALFLAIAFRQLSLRDPFFMRNGFYLLVGWYAGQRFLWEFLKPYAALIGPLNVFHFVAAGLVTYAVCMIRHQRGHHVGS